MPNKAKMAHYCYLSRISLFIEEKNARKHHSQLLESISTNLSKMNARTVYVNKSVKDSNLFARWINIFRWRKAHYTHRISILHLISFSSQTLSNKKPVIFRLQRNSIWTPEKRGAIIWIAKERGFSHFFLPLQFISFHECKFVNPFKRESKPFACKNITFRCLNYSNRMREFSVGTL